QLGSLVVAPIFTTIEKKLLGAVLLDQGPDVYFELSQETITAISRFGQSAGEILSKFSASSEKKLEDGAPALSPREIRSEEHTSELQSRFDLVCRLLLEKKKKKNNAH